MQTFNRFSLYVIMSIYCLLLSVILMLGRSKWFVNMQSACDWLCSLL